MMHERDDRVRRSYNLHLLDVLACCGADGYPDNESGMPPLKPCQVVPERIRAFTTCKNVSDPFAGVHFYLDDFRFSWCWSDPLKYVDMLRRFACVLTPDFSLYVDMPEPLQRFNAYRGRAIGQIWQAAGLEVVPTLTWGFSNSYDFCFDGLPTGSVVSLSTVGLLKDAEHTRLFLDGASEAVRRLSPSVILAYGQPIELDAGGAEVRWYDNERISRLRTIKKG